AEYLDDLLIDFLHDRGQVATAALQVVHLIIQERVAIDEALELLHRDRIHTSEQPEPAVERRRAALQLVRLFGIGANSLERLFRGHLILVSRALHESCDTVRAFRATQVGLMRERARFVERRFSVTAVLAGPRELSFQRLAALFGLGLARARILNPRGYARRELGP